MDLGHSVSMTSRHESMLLDLNEHDGQKRDGAGGCYDNHGYGIRDMEKERILDFQMHIVLSRGICTLKGRMDILLPSPVEGQDRR